MSNNPRDLGRVHCSRQLDWPSGTERLGTSLKSNVIRYLELNYNSIISDIHVQILPTYSIIVL